uniref:Odorant receptor n=1 Tax=Athetis dissimilis TaxID=1737331 RepID=A0A0S1TPK5_ATHDI|nr:odorant receptor 38 [Athetis dissimilis]
MWTLREIEHEIRKFGLEYCDLPTMLENVSILLRVLTVNIDSKYHKGITILSYIVTAVTAVCFYYVFLFSMSWFVFYRSRITGEMVGAMVVLSLGISSEIGPFKLFYMCFYMDKTQKIANDFLECDANTIKGTRFHDNLMKCLRSVKKRAMLFWVVVAGNGVLYVMKPVAMRGRNLPENYFIIYGLEPMFDTPNYQIAYFMMIAGVFFICYVPATVTAFLIVITGYAEAQMRALSKEMLHLWPDAITHAAEKTQLTFSENLNLQDPEVKIIINQFVERRLREIIGRHANIINLLNQVETIFRQAIAMGFVFLALGLLSELLGKLENTFLQLPFALMQVSMDCFAGQRVMDASMEFEESVYDCKWENFDLSNMKLVLVMLQSSQKTMTLSAGGLRTLSFTSLMSVFRGIYSAYTALRSTMK